MRFWTVFGLLGLALSGDTDDGSAVSASMSTDRSAAFGVVSTAYSPSYQIGCTSHSQCSSGQYCYSCALCRGNCARCTFGVTGVCGPSYRCPIDNDSITGTCPGSSSGSCGGYSGCSICTAQPGCVWSGSYCYYSTTPCTGFGCANFPSQCSGGVIPSGCSYYDCSSCTAAQGCVWSGSYCYYATSPCTGYGCANYPSQCNGGVTPGSCSYYDCSSCTAAYGCVWSGSYCYYTTSPCTGYGCANTPSQCYGSGPVTPGCSYSSCSSCTAAYGCVWSGSYCYYSNTPCTGWGCANTPSQCNSGSMCYSDSQCGFGYRCSSGYCVVSTSSGSCSSSWDCWSCLSNPACLWDPNTAYGQCKPKEQCDFTYRPVMAYAMAASAMPPATACVRSTSQCSQSNFNGAVLDPNYSRGLGCTNHGQCGPGQYCFACTRCRGDCSVCYQGGARVSGACGPSYRCAIDQDSIDYTCPF